MAAARSVETPEMRVSEAFARRARPASALAADADAIAHVCLAMAVRFGRGGRLVVFGGGPSSCDAAHIVVEFVHPVIVGKRALPAFALPGPDLAGQITVLGGPADIALGISTDPPGAGPVDDALRVARRAGLLTVGLFGGRPDGSVTAPDTDPGAIAAEYLFVVPSADPLVVKEVQVTTYHLLWELVHVFAEWSDRSGVSR